jgi:hypothetical protein
LINRCTDVYGPIGENRFWWWLSSSDLFIDSAFHHVCLVHPDAEILLSPWCLELYNEQWPFCIRIPMLAVFSFLQCWTFLMYQFPSCFQFCTMNISPISTVNIPFSSKRQCHSRLQTTATPPDVMFKTQDLKTIYINSSWHLIFTMDNIICVKDSYKRYFFHDLFTIVYNCNETTFTISLIVRFYIGLFSYITIFSNAI